MRKRDSDRKETLGNFRMTPSVLGYLQIDYEETFTFCRRSSILGSNNGTASCATQMGLHVGAYDARSATNASSCNAWCG